MRTRKTTEEIIVKREIKLDKNEKNAIDCLIPVLENILEYMENDNPDTLYDLYSPLTEQEIKMYQVIWAKHILKALATNKTYVAE